MECPKCKTQITDADIKAVFTAHSQKFVDLIITCPNKKCDFNLNDFVYTESMIRMNKTLNYFRC